MLDFYWLHWLSDLNFDPYVAFLKQANLFLFDLFINTYEWKVLSNTTTSTGSDSNEK